MLPPTALGGISQERFELGSASFTRFSKTSGPTNLPEMTSPAPSGRRQNAITYYRKVHKTGPKCRKRLMTWKWCEIRQKLSVLQHQSRLQISRVKNIGRVFEVSSVALWWASCYLRHYFACQCGVLSWPNGLRPWLISFAYSHVRVWGSSPATAHICGRRLLAQIAAPLPAVSGLTWPAA